MKTPTILSLVLAIVTVLNSCGDTKENSNILIGGNSDTIQVIKEFPTTEFKEIVKYKNNKPEQFIGLKNNGDSLKSPNLFIEANKKTIFVFLPPFKNRVPESIIVINDTLTKSYKEFLVDSLLHYFEFDITPNMIYDDSIKGAIKYKGFYYIPFVIKKE